MKHLLLAAMALFFSTDAAAQSLPVIWDSATQSAAEVSCVAGAEDPAAVYTVSDDSSTLYSGASLDLFLDAGSDQLLADADDLVVTLNAPARAAFNNYHQCLVPHGFMHSMYIWANTVGGFNFYEADLIEGGHAYDFEAIYVVEDDRVIVQHQRRGNTTGSCDSMYLKGELLDGEPYTITDKLYRPARPSDPGYSKNGCQGAPCSACTLFYYPDGSPAGTAPFYGCGCRYSPSGAFGTTCNHTINATSFEPAVFTDVDGGGDGVGDGGLWGGSFPQL